MSTKVTPKEAWLAHAINAEGGKACTLRARTHVPLPERTRGTKRDLKVALARTTVEWRYGDAMSFEGRIGLLTKHPQVLYGVFPISDESGQTVHCRLMYQHSVRREVKGSLLAEIKNGSCKSIDELNDRLDIPR